MEKVYFLAAAIPALDTLTICKAFIWANQNGFAIEETMTNMVPTTRSAIATPGKQSGVIELVSIYCSTLPETYENKFGEPYSADSMVKIATIIKDEINGIAI